MKLVKEILYEKFKENSDPIKDMRIGQNFPEGFTPKYRLKKQYPGMYFPIGTVFGEVEGWTTLCVYRGKQRCHSTEWTHNYFNSGVGEFYEEI